MEASSGPIEECIEEMPSSTCFPTSRCVDGPHAAAMSGTKIAVMKMAKMNITATMRSIRIAEGNKVAK